ncbi:tetratricopeptide repeat protein [Sphingomonas carotinifaciens]|uniref:tetratricopeptide repeat protein n=1 Tax=Sphingomonas carotinifaciens TaxID=1166323 RepID=UPI0039A34EDC
MEARTIRTCSRIIGIVLAFCPAAAIASADGGRDDLSAYLAARIAAAQGRPDAAAARFGEVLAGRPDDPVIAVRAYREALAAGDDALVRRAAAVLQRADVAPLDVALIAVADAARRNDPAALDAAATRLERGGLAILAPSLHGWAAFARGEDPNPILTATKDVVARRLSLETQVLLSIAAGRDDGGGARIAIEGAQSPLDIRIAAAQLLFHRHRRDAARALIAGSDPTLTAHRRGIGAKPTLAFGVSRLLARVGAEIAGQGPRSLAIALARASLSADPGYDRARLVLADALARDGSEAQALAVLDAVGRKSPFVEPAAASRIGLLDAMGKGGVALDLARARATARNASSRDWQVFADLLSEDGRFAEAAGWYARVVAAEPPVPWAAWMQYGSALDQAGQWAQAEPALARAVALAPDEPLALNYLGYARVMRGQDVAGATKLLETASRIAPNNPSITDSLGWAYHVAGQSRRAVPLLERAAAEEPANAEIAEHLGDVYWALGRRFEARYAWRAAALYAEAPDGERLVAKLARAPEG